MSSYHIFHMAMMISECMLLSDIPEWVHINININNYTIYLFEVNGPSTTSKPCCDVILHGFLPFFPFWWVTTCPQLTSQRCVLIHRLLNDGFTQKIPLWFCRNGHKLYHLTFIVSCFSTSGLQRSTQATCLHDSVLEKTQKQMMFFRKYTLPNYDN